MCQPSLPPGIALYEEFLYRRRPSEVKWVKLCAMATIFAQKKH